MRSTAREPVSVAPGIYSSPSELFETRARVDHWKRANPQAAHLSDRFDDLVFFEIPLREVMSRMDMLVRLDGDGPSSTFPEAELHRSVGTWSRLANFYRTEWKEITRDVRKAYDRSYDDLNAYVAECAALEPHRARIEKAHEVFGSLLSDLLRMGFTYSSIAPQLGRRYYWFKD